VCLIRTNLAKNQNNPIIYRLIRYFETLSGHRVGYYTICGTGYKPAPAGELN
jgi:hypothetical protein